MTRRPAAVTEAEIQRAVRGVERAAPGRFVIEIDPRRGIVRAVPVAAAEFSAAPSEPGGAFACGLDFTP